MWGGEPVQGWRFLPTWKAVVMINPDRTLKERVHVGDGECWVFFGAPGDGSLKRPWIEVDRFLTDEFRILSMRWLKWLFDDLPFLPFLYSMGCLWGLFIRVLWRTKPGGRHWVKQLALDPTAKDSLSKAWDTILLGRLCYVKEKIPSSFVILDVFLLTRKFEISNYYTESTYDFTLTQPQANPNQAPL